MRKVYERSLWRALKYERNKGNFFLNKTKDTETYVKAKDLRIGDEIVTLGGVTSAVTSLERYRSEFAKSEADDAVKIGYKIEGRDHFSGFDLEAEVLVKSRSKGN